MAGPLYYTLGPCILYIPDQMTIILLQAFVGITQLWCSRQLLHILFMHYDHILSCGPGALVYYPSYLPQNIWNNGETKNFSLRRSLINVLVDGNDNVHMRRDKISLYSTRAYSK